MFDFNYDEDAVIRELGIESSGDEFKAHVQQRIRQLLDERMAIRSEMSLSMAEKAEFNRLHESGDLDGARAFLESRLPNAQDMYTEELQNIVSQLKQSMN